ncbi:acyltransferase [Pantoea sp. SM3640]|uniref:acyltransferase family protein n=1 Tax=Pantoea sp. SM3640 TaxID=2787629 RepID=UPI0018A72EAD|nr:acyltransferase [Pantoea sp. SM3640]QPG28477.1 acyltransferase [Pantoea sp. SM3640]
MSQVTSEVNGSPVEMVATTASAISSSRVVFAGQLRAIAFLSVVIVHWFGIYSLDHEFIIRVTGATTQAEGNAAFYMALLPPLPYFNYGPFGVSIFFLISGFVISYSIKKKSRFAYLKSRAMRIYPTYIACSVIMMAIYTISHYYWGSNPEISLTRFLLNATLLSSIFNYESIDYVNWTLSIEIKFYLCCAMLYGAIKSARITHVMALPFMIMVLTLVTSHFQIGSSEQGHFSFDALKIEMMYVSYMVLGILINFLFEKKIPVGEFIASTFVVALCISISWRVGPQANQFIGTGINYIYGYIFFFTAFLMNSHFKDNKLMSFLSEISYSFYALHSVIGYCILIWLESIGVPYLYSILIAFILVMLISCIMYATIEKKTIMLSKKIR